MVNVVNDMKNKMAEFYRARDPEYFEAMLRRILETRTSMDAGLRCVRCDARGEEHDSPLRITLGCGHTFGAECFEASIEAGCCKCETCGYCFFFDGSKSQ